MGFMSALMSGIGVDPPMGKYNAPNPASEGYGAPVPLIPPPDPGNTAPTTQQPMLPQGTNVSPILSSPYPDVRESPAMGLKANQDDLNRTQTGGMGVGV